MQLPASDGAVNVRQPRDSAHGRCAGRKSRRDRRSCTARGPTHRRRLRTCPERIVSKLPPRSFSKRRSRRRTCFIGTSWRAFCAVGFLGCTTRTATNPARRPIDQFVNTVGGLTAATNYARCFRSTHRYWSLFIAFREPCGKFRVGNELWRRPGHHERQARVRRA